MRPFSLRCIFPGEPLDISAEAKDGLAPADLKVILLGDSAVGKSKLVERFLMNNYQPRQLSTYALTLFRHSFVHEGKVGRIEF